MDQFTEISLILAIATIVALILKKLRQPLVIAYIIAGIISGPLVLDLIHSEETLLLFSKIGISVLLFVIGLHLNPKVVKEVGWVSLATGLGQILFTSVIGLGIALLLGYTWIESMFIGIALTFSSTIIILKLLQDIGDLEKLHGKIAIGFLLVQDIAASLILLSVSIYAQSQGSNLLPALGLMSLKILGLGILLSLLSYYLLPKILQFAANSQESLFLFCLAWGMGVASIFVISGLSLEIGALVAGVCISTTQFANEISSRLRPLRDFFIIIFFILLGSEMLLQNIGSLIVPALIFSVFVLIGNPLIVFYLMNLMGYHKRTGLMAGLTVAQISEFSLILITLGISTGLISRNVGSMVTIVGLLTIAISTYMIIYSDKLYRLVSPILGFISIRKHSQGPNISKDKAIDALLFGYGRVGSDYVNTFEKLGLEYLIVDFDPNVINKLNDLNLNGLYGDAEDVEFMTELPLDKLKIVVSTVADLNTDLTIIEQVRIRNKQALILVKTNNVYDAQELYQAGATYVVMPHYIGANYAARLIKRFKLNSKKYLKAQEDHLKFLSHRN